VEGVCVAQQQLSHPVNQAVFPRDNKQHRVHS